MISSDRHHVNHPKTSLTKPKLIYPIPNTPTTPFFINYQNDKTIRAVDTYQTLIIALISIASSIIKADGDALIKTEKVSVRHVSRILSTSSVSLSASRETFQEHSTPQNPAPIFPSPERGILTYALYSGHTTVSRCQSITLATMERAR